jgi:hypothetical protein
MSGVESIDNRILRIIDDTKKSACLEYGWCINLWDRDERSEYPLIHLRIFWSEEENQKVIDEVNSEFFYDTVVKYEDLMVFMNNFNTPECHNAACSLIENSGIARWLLSNGIGNVLCDSDDDYWTLRETGFVLFHMGRYSCIGRISDKPEGEVPVKIEDGRYFIPNPLREISAGNFWERYLEQDRFEILENHSEDFWYYRNRAVERIMEYRENPQMFLEDYLELRESLLIGCLQNYQQNTNSNISIL